MCGRRSRTGTEVSGDAAVQGDHATGPLRRSVDSWCDGLKLCVCVCVFPMTLSLMVVEVILALDLPQPSARYNMSDYKEVSTFFCILVGARRINRFPRDSALWSRQMERRLAGHAPYHGRCVPITNLNGYIPLSF